MILITGSTGILGGHLLVYLLEKSEKLRLTYREGSDRESLKKRVLFENPALEAAWNTLEWVPAALDDIPQLELALEGVETIYHCAGLVSFDPRDRDQLLKVNWEGTQNLVNIALAKGVQTFCYASSVATIGGITETVSEEDAWDPSRTNLYATSKYLGEMEVWRASQEGLNTVIVNPGVILGTGPWNSGSGQLVPAVANGLRYAIPGSSGFVGAWDVARCMLRLVREQQFGQRYILVGNHLSYASLFAKIAAAFQAEGMQEVRAPSKQLKSWHLELLWRLDWLGARISGRKRRLSRDVARSLTRKREYDASRIREVLNFEFEPIDAVIERSVRAYLNASNP
ncbi:Nucleoside-diphosphate-sugar epimerase [Robiginitalea myxolifaciens]|uniref:Nucleoside-diphosphate-sugar epimerase n=1 Tax=Robiginitalea myxolifaciens TaxID=400055 RepID=A0A1I6G967_9FLAO|nr:NAD-dependent epimerase/dehydratase family protein [Robiginitalea myxolifaciens]SFR38617.1 Nucleoside-diphosphate-sugar epimerase [Robiginitalea myxolifaciens]